MQACGLRAGAPRPPAHHSRAREFCCLEPGAKGVASHALLRRVPKPGRDGMFTFIVVIITGGGEIEERTTIAATLEKSMLGLFPSGRRADVKA